LDSYFKSNTFEALVNKAVAQQFESFLASKSFQDMLQSTTKSIVSQVICDSVEAVVAKEIDKAVQPLLNSIADLEEKLIKVLTKMNNILVVATFESMAFLKNKGRIVMMLC
jgi:L-cystine uptake protein TcyP (sodium:dicarboxylate symporter family)